MQTIACPQCSRAYAWPPDTKPGTLFHGSCGHSFQLPYVFQAKYGAKKCGHCGAPLDNPEQDICSYCSTALSQGLEGDKALCSQCLTSNPAKAKFCLECGDSLSGSAPLLAESDLTCPSCKTNQLDEQNHGAMHSFYCKKCHGRWIPLQTIVNLEKSFKKRREDIQQRATYIAEFKEDKSPYSRCPECDNMMQRFNFKKSSGIILDRCHSHGMWFDEGELELLQTFWLHASDSSLNGNIESAQTNYKVVIPVTEDRNMLFDDNSLVADLHLSDIANIAMDFLGFIFPRLRK